MALAVAPLVAQRENDSSAGNDFAAGVIIGLLLLSVIGTITWFVRQYRAASREQPPPTWLEAATGWLPIVLTIVVGIASAGS